MQDDTDTHDELEELVLTVTETRRLLILKKVLNDFESVFQKLQRNDITIGQARRLFDALIEKYPTLGSHIAVDAHIVHSVAFEAALVKLSIGGDLSDEELEAVRPLLLAEVSVWFKLLQTDIINCNSILVFSSILFFSICSYSFFSFTFTISSDSGICFNTWSGFVVST